MEQLTVKVFPAEIAAGVALPHMAVQFVPQEDPLLEREPVKVLGGRFGWEIGRRVREMQTLHYYCRLPLQLTDLQPAVMQMLHMDRP